MKKLLSMAALPLLATMLAAVPGCAGAEDGAEAAEDDLTSLTARQRTLKFGGVVYVDENAADYTIMSQIRRQTQSAFGALREADIGVNSRELKDVDPSTFVKTKVLVVDPNVANDPGKKMMRVAYTFTDNAVVPIPMAKRSAISLAVLNPNYGGQNQRIFEECTSKDTHAREFMNGSIWYVFNPALSSCDAAMKKEQKKVDADRALLGDSQNKVPKSEVDRLYIPSKFALTAAKTNTKAVYPEYDRLYAGGVEPGKLVIGMVSGRMDDWAAGEVHEAYEDAGYGMWYEGLEEIFAARPGMKLSKIEPQEDILNYTVPGISGTVKFADFDALAKFETEGVNPAGVTYANRNKLRAAIVKKLEQHWITFEAATKVTMNGVTKPLSIKLQTYFGAGSDSAPHKRAIKTSDIFVYNGHSYIGYGPLDPSRMTASDFPKSYQIMMINGCVSYNYYEKDYKPLKEGGTANLDLVTNGLESWVNGSGAAMGRFVGAFIDGKVNSYQTILKAAQFTGYGYSWGQDALRVVDGELDNKYKPTATPIKLQ
ncbi:MAG: hypothetical protein U0174_02220 [Polyangiaceae bacterium]